MVHGLVDWSTRQDRVTVRVDCVFVSSCNLSYNLSASMDTFDPQVLASVQLKQEVTHMEEERVSGGEQHRRAGAEDQRPGQPDGRVHQRGSLRFCPRLSGALLE